MSKELKDVWKENLKNSLASFSAYVNWLIILDLTITLTYCVQYLQLKRQQEDVKKYDNVLKRPWPMLQTYFDEMEADSVANYANKKILPCVRLSMLDVLGNSAITSMNFPKDTKANAEKSLVELKYVFNAFVEYDSYLTEIAAAKRNSVRFEDLDKTHLNALLYIWNFGDTSRSARFKNAFSLVVNDCQTYYRDTIRIKILTVYASGGSKIIPKPSPILLRQLSYALSRPDLNFQDFNMQSTQQLSDFKTFFQKNPKDSLKIVKNAVDSIAFETLNKVNADKVKTQSKIADFESGASVSIPLTTISVSLIQFVTIAGILNLLVLCYCLVLCNKIKQDWKQYSNSTVEKAELAGAYFYNWTYHIQSRKLFVVLFAIVLSFCSLLSLFFALMLGPISDHKFIASSYILIWAFALLNFIIAIIVGKKYLRLDQTNLK